MGAAIMPFNAYTTSAYFTLRSGGRTAIPIVPLYIICQGTDLIKCALDWWMIKKGSWIQNLAFEQSQQDL